jgi:molybdate-binding protein/DNA-binding XRE family transcriptional regulator
MPPQVQNQLSTVRRARGAGVSDLARRVGVSRQTIYAIEAGTYIPNTEVALRLARELEVSVEELFTLGTEKRVSPESLMSEVLSATAAFKGQAVRVCQVGSHVIGIPVNASPYFLPEADGVIASTGRAVRDKAELVVFSKDGSDRRKVILAGCDPAIGLVTHMVEKLGGVEIVSAAASSRLALTWLKEGKVHIAGTHLEDPETGEFNLPFIRREFPGGNFTVVTFAGWEEGFVTAAGNPRKIRKAEDLAKKSVRFVNREAGSGSRALLDSLLVAAALPSKKVAGYDHVAYGHLAAAYSVLSAEADCCLATRSAAQTFGLDFVPLKSERYDFVMRRESLEIPAVQVFLDVLQRASLRRKLEVLAGYDTAQTGAVLV